MRYNIYKGIYKRANNYAVKDGLNKFYFGDNAPKFQERIFVNPRKINHRFYIKRSYSGLVYKGKWPISKSATIESDKKLQYCVSHWVHNNTWEETGALKYLEKKIIQKGVYDGCKNKRDIINRYNKLDEIFIRIKKHGFKSRTELGFNFRESGGVIVHIGPNNKLFFGNGGHHRFAMAKILDLKLIPAMLGVVHIDSLQYLNYHRNEHK